MDLYDGHLISQAADLLRVLMVAIGCGWFAERLVGSDDHGWFVPVFSGIVGIYIGPRLVQLLGWKWGPSLGSHLLIPIFAGALVACLFVRLLTLGLAAARR